MWSKLHAKSQPAASGRGKAEARANWNFADRTAKLLALGASDGKTVDFDRMVAERHAREREIVSRLELGTGRDIVMDLAAAWGLPAR